MSEPVPGEHESAEVLAERESAAAPESGAAAEPEPAGIPEAAPAAPEAAAAGRDAAPTASAPERAAPEAAEHRAQPDHAAGSGSEPELAPPPSAPEPDGAAAEGGPAAPDDAAAEGGPGTPDAPGTPDGRQSEQEGSQETATAGGVGDDVGDAAALGMNGPVTVVPGIARYHRGLCILIRFLGADDLETMTRAAAEEADFAPCRACQPDIALADS